MNLVGTIAALAGNFATLSATGQLNLPNSQIEVYDPTPAATPNFSAVGRNEGYTLNLGGIKISWGVTRWERTALGGATSPLFTVQNLGTVFGATPVLVANIESVGGQITQYITMNSVVPNSFNFFLNDNTTIGSAFNVSWFALGN